MRRRSLVFPQQCYADDGMWMETHQAQQQQQQQQQSYAFHEEESWNSEHNNNNNHHHAIHNHKQQQFPGGMHMKPGAAAFAMDHSKHHGMPGSGHGHGFGGYGNKKFPFGTPTTNNYNNAPHHHQFPNGGGGGGARFNNNYGSHGHHRDYIAEEEEYEYEAYHSEEHVGGVKGKMEEMRYEHRNWGGGDVRYANPYGGYNNNNNMKPHGHGGHKVEWTAKGV